MVELYRLRNRGFWTQFAHPQESPHDHTPDDLTMYIESITLVRYIQHTRKCIW